jgi:putative heme-binding domain-containing protein
VYFEKGSGHILERLLLFLLGMASVCVAVVLQSGAQQSMHPKPQFKSPNTEGQKVFASACAGCHGLDGRGGERAPDIAQKREIQRLSDSEIMRIVREGVPGTGMPAFHSLASSEVKAVVSYLRSLQGTNQTVELPGSPVRGRAVFHGEAGCSACHMVAGRGGFIASDLSGYARTHSVQEIRSVITQPKPAADRQARSAVVVNRAGQQYSGRIRNEDNFSLQLQSLDGTFLFFFKSDIERLEYNSQPLMPSNYSSTLSAKDLDDLVSFLINSAKTSEREFAGEADK